MPGSRFASARKSASVSTPSEACTASTTGCREIWMTGTKSFAGLKLSLKMCAVLAT